MDRTVYQVYKEYLDGEVENWWVGKEVGIDHTVTKIEYHQPAGEGDAHYCDVHIGNGTVRRVFRPDNIDFGEVE